MNCLLLDDEALSLESLKDSVQAVPFLNLCFATQKPLEALKFLNHHPVDLIFTDLQMPQLNGFDLIRTLKNAPMVIMVTGHHDHALASFELSVIDYVLKPISFQRFLQASQKAYDLHLLRLNNKPRPDDINADRKFFYVNAGYSLFRVDQNDITYIEALKDFIRINLSNGKSLVSRTVMKEFEHKLTEDKFMRVHRSYIVAIDKIEVIQKNKIIVAGQEIPVSDGYRSVLQDYVARHNI